MSAIKLIKNPEFHQRSKHIDVRYHFIQDKYKENEFLLEHVISKEQQADLLTKALPKMTLQRVSIDLTLERVSIGLISIDCESSRSFVLVCLRRFMLVETCLSLSYCCYIRSCHVCSSRYRLHSQ